MKNQQLKYRTKKIKKQKTLNAVFIDKIEMN